jgi:hypothetical protein
VAGYFPPETQFREENEEEFKVLHEFQKDPSFFLQDSIIQWFYIDKFGKYFQSRPTAEFVFASDISI